MTGAMLTQLLQAFIMLSVFLLIGTFLRAVVPVFQKTFLPASVIGGFVALLLGPIVWDGGGLPFPSEWVTTWRSLPGVLIVPVVASVPLGLAMGRKKASDAGGADGGIKRKASAAVIIMFCIAFGTYMVQILVGLGTNALFRNTYDLYPTFGYELAKGFVGGHGTAGVLGGFLNDLGVPYWELAQGITVATATFGLVIGVLSGIVFINIMARKGKTVIIKEPKAVPPDMLRGVQLDPAKQASTGKETTYNTSIESFTFHLAVILLACGVAYLSQGFVQRNNIPVITAVPVWTYAIIGMFGINYIINKTGLYTLIDPKTKSRITGTLTDFAVTAAIAAMPVRAILHYIVPLMFMVIVGFIFTYIATIMIAKRVFADYHTERSVALWGLCTGVFIDAVLLLKVCDPELESPVLGDLSMGFAIHSMLVFIMMPVFVNLMINSGLLATTFLAGGILIVVYAIMLVASRSLKQAQG